MTRGWCTTTMMRDCDSRQDKKEEGWRKKYKKRETRSSYQLLLFFYLVFFKKQEIETIIKHISVFSSKTNETRNIKLKIENENVIRRAIYYSNNTIIQEHPTFVWKGTQTPIRHQTHVYTYMSW